jgi:hypothetical protein
MFLEALENKNNLTIESHFNLLKFSSPFYISFFFKLSSGGDHRPVIPVATHNRLRSRKKFR